MEFYIQRHSQFTAQVQQLKAKYNTISFLRLLVIIAILALAYQALQTENTIIFLIAISICIIGFFALIQFHNRIERKKSRAEALAAINDNEDKYLNADAIPFDDGTEFINYKHPYSYDLDIFGAKSLYHNINRTYTYTGSKTLAKLLLDILPQQEILLNQEAIQELAELPEWRQEIMAMGYQNRDNEVIHNTLVNWSLQKPQPLPAWIIILSFVMPVLLLGSLAGWLITGNDRLLAISGYIFPLNIMLIPFVHKHINHETGKSTEIHSILENYSHIISAIENAEFKSIKLKSLQDALTHNNTKASKRIKQLSELFSRLDTISNLFVLVAFNGLFLFHIHVLRALIKWKISNAADVEKWLDVIGETEALSSLGNLYYNNPDFTFPNINTDYKISFENLAHPLINRHKRVGNTVTFSPQFIILTGSNMSGKSTFLRSLGINMVLAGIGAPVCATAAVIHPLPVLVSMRLSDSLSDSESYFFAEIKRLKLIMDSLENQRAFVLLDEILRGTNSDDKQSGTIAVIKKIIDKQAIGAIATHDIEVCNTTNSYPGFLSNQCFEVQIVNNELYFDYTLRNGICKNKSATFIMDKMGVI